MKVKAHKLIAATFIFSFLALLAATAALTLRIIDDKTGLHLSYFSPGCPNSYGNLKYAYTYIILLAQFVANILAAATALLRCLLLISPVRQVCATSEESGGLDAEKEVKLQAVYICVSLQLLCWLVCMGGSLNIWIEAKSCVFQFLFYNLLVGILSLIAGIITLVCWILVMCLNRHTVTAEIRFEDIKQSREEDELNKRMEAQMREYLEEINKNKLEKQNQLLAYEQQIYNSNRLNQENHIKQTEKEQSEYEYYYEEVEEGEEPQEAIIEATEHQEEEIIPSPEQSPGDHSSIKVLGSPLSRGFSKRSGKKVADQKVDLLKVPNQNREGQNQDDKNYNPSEGTPDNRKMSQVSRNSSGSQAYTSESPPSHPRRPEALENYGWGELQNFQLQGNDQPISEEVGKLVKVTLFENSAFFKSNKPKLQEQCPLQKYLLKDSRFEIAQPGKFDKKNKKNEYSKEQLYFAKQRKDKLGQQQMYKNIMKKEYNESQAIKKERPDMLNQLLVGHLEEMEKDREEQLPSRYKKYNVLESIRSKYHA